MEWKIPEDKKGKFNQALFYMTRLDEILKALDIAIVKQDYKQAYHVIRAYYFELRPIMTLEEKEVHSKKKDQLRQQYNLFLQDPSKSKLIYYLEKWWEELSDSMQAHGLLMPTRSEVDETPPEW